MTSAYGRTTVEAPRPGEGACDVAATQYERHQEDRRCEENHCLAGIWGRSATGLPGIGGDPDTDATRLDLKTSFSGASLTVAIDVQGIDRVDLYLDGRPINSEELTGMQLSIDIVDVTPGQFLRADGYEDGVLVASHRHKV